MLADIKRLYFNFIKNMRIVFRSWSSVLLLIVGPLLLILLVGFAFGGEDLHDINIGVYAKNFEKIRPIAEQLGSGEITVSRVSSVDQCTSLLKISAMDLCAEFSDDFTVEHVGKKPPSGKITFYFDNTKYNLASDLKDYVKTKTRMSSEQITLASTKAIISDIESSVEFMKEAGLTVDEFMENGKNMRQDLLETKQDLIELKEDFDPVYAEAKDLQKKVNDNTIKLNESADTLVNLIDKVVPLLSLINIDENSTVGKILNLTGFSETALLAETLESLKGSIRENKNDVMSLTSSFNDLMIKLDEINEFLNTSIEKIDKNLEILDKELVEINSIALALDENIDKFSGLNQSQADILLNPITTEFRTLLPKAEKITIIFPLLLVFVISFISILLSNIIVQNETHSPGYFRSFLIPTENIVFLLGLFLTNMVIVCFQIFILLLVAYFSFGIEIFSVFDSLGISIILVTTIFVLIGMIFGFLIRSEQTSTLMGTFFALALFLFSDIIFPLEIMPKLAAYIASFNPLVIGSALFRRILFFQLPLGVLYDLIFTLLVYVLVLFFLVMLAQWHNRKKS
ncbi:ABC transporter permease [Nanoarchaeota archaeon]